MVDNLKAGTHTPEAQELLDLLPAPLADTWVTCVSAVSNEPNPRAQEVLPLAQKRLNATSFQYWKSAIEKASLNGVVFRTPNASRKMKM